MAEEERQRRITPILPPVSELIYQEPPGGRDDQPLPLEAAGGSAKDEESQRAVLSEKEHPESGREPAGAEAATNGELTESGGTESQSPELLLGQKIADKYHLLDVLGTGA